MPKAPTSTMPKVPASASRPRVGRPPLPSTEIDARVEAYCARYGVVATAGMPPFPAGQRETRQHREWLALYTARQRQSRRSAEAAAPGTQPMARSRSIAAAQAGAGSQPGATCELCGRPLEGRRPPLHPACAALARAAEAAGPDALAGLGRFLHRDRRR